MPDPAFDEARKEITDLRDKIKRYSKIAEDRKGSAEGNLYRDTVQTLQEKLFDVEKKVPIGERTSGGHKQVLFDAEKEAKKAASNAKRATTRAANKLKSSTKNAQAFMNTTSTESFDDRMKRLRREQLEKDKKDQEEYARTHPEEMEAARKQFKEIQAFMQNRGKKVQDSVEKTVKNVLPLPTPKTTAEKIQELQYKTLLKQQRKESLPGFNLPDIPKDTATSVVIGSLLATFLILMGAGTKFSQLWGYAFNAPISGAGPGQANDSWDLPDPFKEIA